MAPGMRIAVASGKGGTGKTTVAASLAWLWPRPVVAVDLDVEEPNLHLFLRPEMTGKRVAELITPAADESLCTACGACGELCQFKAISVLADVLLTFPEMCHGCGGCLAVCPEKALSPQPRVLGEVEWGLAEGRDFLMGRLRVGEAMSPPLMRQVRERLHEMLAERPADVIVDAPPGVSCPAMNAVMDSDVIILVTEPTPFGLFDLSLAHEAFTPLGIPMLVVLNRAGVGDDGVLNYCSDKGLAVAAQIPFSRQAAEAYSRGEILAQADPKLRAIFQGLVDDLLAAAGPGEREASHA